MLGRTHELVSRAVFDTVKDIKGDFSFYAKKGEVAYASKQTDYLEDLEWVDVECVSGVGTGRDDPHRDEWAVMPWDEDEARYKPWGQNVTGFNHFIDIRKGAGTFDDYDGYSYHRGSACRDENQTIADWLVHDCLEVDSALGALLHVALDGLSGSLKVDEGLNYFFNDEYVHAPGQKWYRGCSPAVERYSYCADKGTYTSVEEEARARFPLAEVFGGPNRGIPYSTFMPVDNLARYWYIQFGATNDPGALGRVMHAIQDASIPHHAAGCNGNWHSRYEVYVADNAPNWTDPSATRVQQLLSQWDWDDPSPPSPTAPPDLGKRPAKNWPIDQLVTWVAVNAFTAYRDVYNGFRGGFKINADSAADLYQIATAMCAHVLMAVPNIPPPPPKACQSIVDRITAIQRKLKTVEHMLSMNLPEEQHQHWMRRQVEGEMQLDSANKELARCRLEHPGG